MQYKSKCFGVFYIYIYILARKYNSQSANIVKCLLSLASVLYNRRELNSLVLLYLSRPGMNCCLGTVHPALEEKCAKAGMVWLTLDSSVCRFTVSRCLQAHLGTHTFPHSHHVHIFCQMQINKALSMGVLICFKHTAKIIIKMPNCSK